MDLYLVLIFVFMVFLRAAVAPLFFFFYCVRLLLLLFNCVCVFICGSLSCTDFCLYGIFANCGRTAAFSVFRRGALPRGLRVTGSKLCRCRILAALWVCSRRHPVVPRGRGNCKPDKAGISPSLVFALGRRRPCRRFVANTFTSL